MTKLFAILLCLIFTLGIIVASMSKINDAIVKDGGLRDKSITWIDKSIPEAENQETE